MTKPEEYIGKRLDDQIKWYSQKSTSNQKRYKTLKTIVIALSVSIPFMAGLIKNEGDWLKIAVGVGGVLIALFEGILSLQKYQELWIQYRTIAEALNREKIMFQTRTGHYKGKDAFQQLVIRAEAIMSAENQSWQDITAQTNTDAEAA